MHFGATGQTDGLTYKQTLRLISFELYKYNCYYCISTHKISGFGSVHNQKFS